MRVIPKLFVLLSFVLTAANGWSQTDQSAPVPKAVEPGKYYRLEFVVKEMENGKQIGARNYSLSAAAGGSGNNCSVRAGNKIPTPTGKDGQFTYIDVGVSLDCRELREVEGKLAFKIQADISGAAGEVPSVPTTAPVIRQFRWASEVLVPLRKATVICQSDDASSKGGIQLELTATPLQ